eukprot:Opistho-1_new@39092
MTGGGEGTSALVEAAKSIAAGTVAGMVSKTIEYPLDTVKVLLQTQKAGPSGMPYAGSIDCIRKVVRAEGMGALYRGLSAPLAGAMMENAAIFTAFRQMQLLVQDDIRQPLGTKQAFACGAGAGVFSATVLSPIELIKCRLQVQQESAGQGPKKYKGALSCIAAIAREEGLRAFYKGFSATLLREIPGNAFWFGTFHTICNAMTPEGKSRDDLPPYVLVGAGAAAGALYWGVPYPADAVKSRMQTMAHPGSLVSVFRDIARESGIRGFYAGCAITVARAAPSNAVIFTVYELTMRWLG